MNPISPFNDLPEAPPSQPAPALLGPVADLSLPVQLRFGRAELRLGEALKLAPGSVLDIQKAGDELVDLVVNGKTIARGVLVEAAGNYAVRIESIPAPACRVS